MIEYVLCFLLGYSIAWCINNPDKVKAAWKALMNK